MYRAGLEWILGFRLQGDCLELDPCIPGRWPGFEIALQVSHRALRDRGREPGGRQPRRGSAELDGRSLPDGLTRLKLVDDGRTHSLRLVLGKQQQLIGRTLGEKL